MKRICIYLTYDKHKVVDRYVGYILKELKTCVDYLVVVCNEEELIHGIEILQKYADNIFYRKNIGFDAGGYKDALCNYVGWEKVLLYDELVLVNDSIFGPFKPMTDIFAEMDKKDIDFWGLSEHGERDRPGASYIPRHIQSFFFVIRSRMLHCVQFKNYWEDMPYFLTFNDAIEQHELKFTQLFYNMGYTFSSLANTDENNSKNKLYNYSQYKCLAFELIEKRNFPFLKKQQIVVNTLYCQTQENLYQAIEYIDKSTDYDVDLIWENLIRTLNMTDLQRNLHLQYIISEYKMPVISKNILFAVFITYNQSFEYVYEYLKKIDTKCCIKIFAFKNEYLSDYKKHGFECKKICVDKIVKLFVKFSAFDFVCILHDADITSDKRYSCTGKSYFYNIWGNLVKNSDYISGILKKFLEEPRLGFLTPPYPNFGEYFGDCGKGWNGRFESVLHTIKKLEINCELSEDKPPFRIANNFWIRGNILRILRNMEEKDSLNLPYLWSYFAQDAGYYSGIVESQDYAAMNEVNLQYYLDQIASQIRRQNGSFHTFDEMKERMLLSALKAFCAQYSRILVYGAGKLARKYSNFLSDIEAFIVSDGEKKLKELNGIPIKYLSEIKEIDNCGIILCLNVKNQREVISLLQKYENVNYFCI